MQIGNQHLTYCTNIHPGESWEQVFANLKSHIPIIKTNLIDTNQAFGIGLRLSALAAEELLIGENLQVFKQWLIRNNCYVFTLNGFPYGNFHNNIVKDKVHQPDWQTEERFIYTRNLIDILSYLLPKDLEGGISTSPVSYKHWHVEHSYNQVFQNATSYFAKLIDYLDDIYLSIGKLIHIDIEPEPDGLIENSSELVNLFTNYLLPFRNESSWQKKVLRHIQVCYDVCHFALAYEEADQVIPLLEKHQIKVGKVQISAALKILINNSPHSRIDLYESLKPFAESTYLHQVTTPLQQFPDLTEVLPNILDTQDHEWRIHFHVPVFLENYGILSSTQEQIKKVLALQAHKPFTQHLEIETYTWDVLPLEIKQDINESIQREFKWVMKQMKLD